MKPEEKLKQEMDRRFLSMSNEMARLNNARFEEIKKLQYDIEGLKERIKRLEGEEA